MKKLVINHQLFLIEQDNINRLLDKTQSDNLKLTTSQVKELSSKSKDSTQRYIKQTNSLDSLSNLEQKAVNNGRYAITFKVISIFAFVLLLWVIASEFNFKGLISLKKPKK